MKEVVKCESVSLTIYKQQPCFENDTEIIFIEPVEKKKTL